LGKIEAMRPFVGSMTMLDPLWRFGQREGMKPLLALIALFAIYGAVAADDLVPAQECRPRAGLPNFPARR
jgi:hypothetical protein